MKKQFKIICLIGLVLIFASCLFIYFCPLLQPYPKPSGKYCVGNQLLHFVDTQNKYQFEKINEFNVDIFYPSNESVQKRFLYRPEQISAINNDVVASLSDGSNIKKLFWNLVVRNAYPFMYPHAALTSDIPKIPVVLYLPGIAAYDMHILYLSELASHGYLVCAIEPPYDTVVTVFPDKRHIKLDSSLQKAQQEKNRELIYKYRDQAHIRWSKYIDMTIDNLEQLNNDPASMWYQRLDLNHLGLLGHSHGGAVALDYCQRNSRCKAGINMDGWTKTYNKPDAFQTPFLLLMGDHGGIINIPQVKDLIENNERPNFQSKIIAGAYHGSFGDGILTPWPWNYLFGALVKNPEKIRLEINNNLLTFMDQYLNNKKSEQTRPLALINLGDHSWILQAQQQIKPIIDSIIKEEVVKANPSATDFPKFYSKQRHLITLLYSKQVPVDMQQSIIDAFTQISAKAYPTILQLSFSDHLDFFGKDQSELIVKINDPKQYLPKLRQFIIDSLPAQLHADLATKEHNQFEFAPHETLGRIPVDELEKCSNKDTVEKIKKRIVQEVKRILQKLSVSNNIKPTELFVYGNDFKPIFTQDLEFEQTDTL